MRHASLFSGIGGPEVAAAMLGWENVFHCEINPFGRKILEYWFPNSKSYEDIKTTDFKEWRGKVDVLSGGFPCQPFSYAGQRAGENDDRYLWPEMLRVIDEVRPAWVVGENVAGITTMVEQGKVSEMGGQTSIFGEDDGVHRYRLDETFTIERICKDLENLGYAVQPVVIPACAVGAPHRRDRVFILGHSNDINGSETEREIRKGKDTESGRVCSDAQDPVRRGQLVGQDDEHGRERNERVAGAGAGCENREACDKERRACEGGRESVRQDYGQTRAGGAGAADSDASADTDNAGDRTQRNSGREGQKMDQRSQEQPLAMSGGLGEQQHAPNTDNTGLERPASQRVQGYERRGEHDEFRQPAGCCGENGAERTDADTDSRRVQGLNADTSLRHERDNQEPVTGDGRGGDIAGCGRWNYFPTVPPVHRGNDGLPFDVDRLTISFGKWRTESLKAYGNAIVPQVMYEIFKTIQLAHQK